MAAFVLGVLLYSVGSTMSARPWNAVVQGLGGLMASVVSISFGWELIFGEARDKAVVREVLTDPDVLADVKQVITDGLVPSARELGLIGIENVVDFDNLFHELRDGDELLWLATYIETDFDEALTGALRLGAKVRMLVIDPDSSCLEMRAGELTNRYRSSYREQAQTHLDRLRALEKVARSERLQIRTYRDLPNASTFLVKAKDRVIRGHTGFYVGVPIVRAPHLRWTQGPMLDLFDKYFEQKWNRWGPSAAAGGAGSRADN